MIFALSNDKKYIRLTDSISDAEMRSIRTYFRRKALNFYFDPRYRSGVWDGYDSFFNDGYVAVGLWKELRDFLVGAGYPVRIDGLDTIFNVRLNIDEFNAFVEELIVDTKIRELRWFQIPAAYKILKYRHCMAEIATSAGKTLISYIIASYLVKNGEADKDNKFVMIVPRAGLVKQTADKFEIDYDNGTSRLKVCKLGGQFNPKLKKTRKALEEAEVVITTYQTLANMEPEFFSKIRHVNVDEAHTATNATIRGILEKCGNLIHKFGLSGTLEIEKKSADYMRMQECLGPNVMVVTAKELIDSNYSPDVRVRTIKLKYDTSRDNVVRDYVELVNAGNELCIDGKEMYNMERQIIASHERRICFLVSFIKSLNMNTLVLFNDIKGKFGRTLYERLVEDGENAMYIDGHVDCEDRDLYSEATERGNNVKLIASFGTFSTGNDISAIYNIVLAESYKSPIMLRQSIGRGMRALKGKHSVNIIDIVDTFGKYSTKHYKKRHEIYVEQKFQVTEYEYAIKY